jgi:hypothetical protein
LRYDRMKVAVAEKGGVVRSLGTIPNRLSSARKLVEKLGDRTTWCASHDAGPTLVPVNAGPGSRTGSRQGRSTAGSSTLRHVSSAAQRRPSQNMRVLSQRHLDWIRQEVKFDQFAQQATLKDHLAEVEYF